MAGGPPGETESQAIENWNHRSCATLGRLFAGIWNQDNDLEDELKTYRRSIDRIAQLGLAGWTLFGAGEGFIEMKRDAELARIDLASNEMTLTHYTQTEEPE